MAYIYKKFTAQDKALIPFNAHKQYNFTSASAASNSVTHHHTQWTSESISLYSTASSIYGGDSKNVIKYYQIDHLFYRDYLESVGNRYGLINYLKQPRKLYKKANILSIPTGLYGFEIRKGSFYLSSSFYEVTDDSTGNLIISGTNLSDYPDDIQENVFSLEPVKGFKRFDLDVFSDYVNYEFLEGKDDPGKHDLIVGSYWRRGKTNPNPILTYTTDKNVGLNQTYIPEIAAKERDDSYFRNELFFNKMNYSVGGGISNASQLSFTSTNTSFISSSHHPRFNFGKDNDFSISFYMSPQTTGSDSISTDNFDENEKRHIINKSGASSKHREDDLNQSLETFPKPQFPFEIYFQSSSIYFNRSDGNEVYSINAKLTTGSLSGSQHITCQQTGSKMQIWHNGYLVKEETKTIVNETKNNSNLCIGTKRLFSEADTSNTVPDKNYNGFLSNINIWSRAYSDTQIKNISESLNGSPYIGNIFYQHGFATITHPKYLTILGGAGTGEMAVGEDFIVGADENYQINTLQFQGSHLIYEHEYQCTVSEHEYNGTTNITARKNQDKETFELSNFATGSYFKPYVTTVGLYNEEGELLVVGKLGQPIKMSDETDTTFVLRWDS
tara:strand:- start:728 stop:2566 length:1839 start_codon:yes stop_codon:yes gene_type:complete